MSDISVVFDANDIFTSLENITAYARQRFREKKVFFHRLRLQLSYPEILGYRILFILASQYLKMDE